MLEVSQLTVNYGAITALHDVSLRVDKGEIVTLIGGNGELVPIPEPRTRKATAISPNCAQLSRRARLVREPAASLAPLAAASSVQAAYELIGVLNFQSHGPDGNVSIE